MAKNEIDIQKMDKQDYGRKEAFNSLRTNLQFCGDDIQIILLTSCTPNEGKSTMGIQLAHSMGEAGKKVLLVDADLRKSVLVGRHGMRSQKEIRGLSHYLSGQEKMEEVIYVTNLDNVELIVAGPVVPNPTELLGNRYFEKLLEYGREHYDTVIIDSPPLGSVIDTAVIAPKCDGAILVIESGAISYRFVQEVKKQLEVTGCRILGAVLNKVELDKGAYKGYYKGYYRGYYKGYYQKDEEA
ncbi:MAG: polysaccharide biosynthesis tyrosine autokinase [Roseburia sp.]|nr:polysaccharide biosynthesis tyrosine autokinase [Roseburia sp.]MCM1277878.1 polysaccharide biosynthesis tyrosine autokinase [Robinsoniella sp.]